MGLHGRSIEELFWPKVAKRGAGECWLWTGAIVRGYGQLWIGGRHAYAHRVSLEFRLGRSLAKRMFACHHCDTPACVNPAHLYEGTNSDNMRDASVRGRRYSGFAALRDRATEIAWKEAFKWKEDGESDPYLYGRACAAAELAAALRKTTKRAA